MYEQTSSWTVGQIAAQAPVYDAAGEKVGRVEEYVRPGEYLLVEKGWFTIHDMYIPARDIARADDQGVYLRIMKDQLRDPRYATPPTVAADTGTPPATAAETLDRGGRGAAAQPVAPAQPEAAPSTVGTAEIGDAFQERDFEVPVLGETVTVGKRVRGVEEVHLHKEVVTETEQVHDTVRKERVDVEETGSDVVAP